MGRIEKLRASVRFELREFRKYLRDNPARAIGAGIFLLIAAWGSAMNHWNLVISDREPLYFLSDAIKDIGPELAGIVVGVLTIDYFNARRQDEQLKRQLILQMGSKHGDVADSAVRMLRIYGWLSDGSLKRANLRQANLKGAKLERANLEGADLTSAVLQNADLRSANLTSAKLTLAILKDAVLIDTDLTGASVAGADLEGATFSTMTYDRTLDRVKHGGVVEQLTKANTVEGATMTDGVKLASRFDRFFRPDEERPTFEEWAAKEFEACRRYREHWKTVGDMLKRSLLDVEE